MRTRVSQRVDHAAGKPPLRGGKTGMRPWGRLVGHAAWQGALVGLAALVVVGLGRRLPSHVCYWVLVLALVKFVTPPLTPLPTGAFSLVSIRDKSPAAGTEADAAAPSSPSNHFVTDGSDGMEAASIPTEQSFRDATSRADSGTYRMRQLIEEGAHRESTSLNSEPSSPAVAGSLLGQTQSENNALLPDETASSELALASEPKAALAKPVSRWLTLGLLAHLAGTIVVLILLVVRALSLHLSWRQMQQPDARLIARMGKIAHDLGLRRLPALRISQTEPVPYSVGLLRPAIVLPARQAVELSPGELDAVLAHELAHHRRGDLWINLVQLVIGAAWWFHPVVWLLNRAIRNLREDCCDDLLLSRNFVTDEAYCQTLVRVAGMRDRRRLAIADPAVSIAGGAHPLAGRIRRIMDESLPRTGGLSRKAAIALVAAAAVVLPGLHHLRSTERTVSAATNAPQYESRDTSSGEKTSKLARDAADDAAADPTPVWPREIRIRIIDENDQPVEGASVALRFGPDGSQEQSGEDGLATIALPGVPPDAMQIIVDKEPYVRMSASWRPGADPDDMPPAEFVFRLTAGRRAGGRIVDEQRRPVGSATITLNISADLPKNGRAQPAPRTLDATSAPDGTWFVSRLPNEISRGSLKIRHPEFVSDAILGTIDRKAIEQMLDLNHEHILKRGVSLFGNVTDDDGNPIADVSVALGQTGLQNKNLTVTDVDGRYRIEHCLPGSDTFTVLKPGLAPQMRNVTVSEVESANKFDFRLKRGHRIRIRVTDKESKPVEGVKISPSWSDGSSLSTVYNFDQTDAKGIWTWDWAPDDEIQFSVYKQGAMRIERVALRPRDEPHELTLLPALHITGKVVDDKTGRPVAAFGVTPGITQLGDRKFEHWSRHETVAGRRGAYSIGLESPYEAHALRIEASGYLPQKSRNVRSDEGEVTLDFRLIAGRQPEGIVLSPDGKPQDNARVILGTIADRPYIRANGETDSGRGFTTATDADGRFTFPPQSDDFTIYVFGASGFGQANKDDLAHEGGEPVRIKLKPWARISGMIRTRTLPLADQPIGLTFSGKTGGQSYFGPHAYFDFSTQTDAQGRFRFDRVPPETEVIVSHNVEIRFAEGSTNGWGHSAQFKLATGQIRAIVLGGSGRDIIGKVELKSNEKIDFAWESQLGSLRPVKPLPDAGIVYRGPAAFRIARDGAFRIEGVDAGDYVLSISAQQPHSLRQPNPQPLGRIEKSITLPPVENGTEDQPFDIGTLTIAVTGTGNVAAPQPLLKSADRGAPRPAETSDKPFRLQRRIIDRAGRPVAGAKAMAWYGAEGSPRRVARETDARSEVAFDAIPSFGAWLFVAADGFRFQGAYIDSSESAGTLTLVRHNEAADEPPLVTAWPINPGQEALMRARKALREFAGVVMRGSNAFSQFAFEQFLAEYDPQFAVDLHSAHSIDFSAVSKSPTFGNWHNAVVKSIAARELARSDPKTARSIIETISGPADRAWGLAWCAGEVGANERKTALDWLREARRLAGQATDSCERADKLAGAAAKYRDLGERDTALAVFREAAAEALKPSQNDRAEFVRAHIAWELAPLDLKGALELMPMPLVAEGRDANWQLELTRKIERATDKSEREQMQKDLTAKFEHDRYYGNMAHQLAAVNPPEAERLLQALGTVRDEYSVRVCYRMAAVDLPRARRISAGIKNATIRAQALGVIADAIARRDKTLARTLLREAFALLAVETEPAANNERRHEPLAIAVGLLPTVERIDPTLVREYLWQTLSLRDDAQCDAASRRLRRKLGRSGSEGRMLLADGVLAAAVARYEPQLARLLAFSPGDGTLELGFREAPYFLLGAVAVLDPLSAIDAASRLPEGTDQEVQQKLEAWGQIIPLIARSPDERWNWLMDNQLRIWRIDKSDL